MNTKKYIPLIGTGVVLVVMIVLLFIDRFDWGTFTASLPSLIVVYNIFDNIVSPKEVENSLEGKFINQVKNSLTIQD